MQQQLVELVGRASPVRPGRRRGWRGGRPCPRRPGRCRARWCRSCASPHGRLARPVDRGVQRQDQGGVVGDPQRLGRDGQRPARATRSISRQQRLGVDHHAVADDAELAAHQARRAAATACRSGCRPRACGRHCGRPGSARRRRPGWPASRRSCLCPRRPIGRRSPSTLAMSYPNSWPDFGPVRAPETAIISRRYGDDIVVCEHVGAMQTPRLGRVVRRRLQPGDRGVAALAPRGAVGAGGRYRRDRAWRGGAARSTASGNRVSPVAGSSSPQM